MRFLADESFEGSLVEFLRAQGHDVVFVAEMSPGLSDTDVIALANQEQRVLLTNDKDFGELAFRQRKAHHGIVLLRFRNELVSLKKNRISQLLAAREASLATAFTVLSDHRMRLRHFPTTEE